MEKEIHQQLEDLKQCLEKAKALHAWKQLKDSEHSSSLLLAFQMYDPVEKDLTIEVSYFIARTMDLHAVLDEKQSEWAIVARSTLIAMEREIAPIRKRNIYK
jgi:hypothetical protein